MTVEAGTYSIMNISWKNPDSLAFTVIDDAALGMASVRLRGKFCPTVFSAAGISDSTAAAVPIDSHIPFSIADEVPVIPGPLSGECYGKRQRFGRRLQRRFWHGFLGSAGGSRADIPQKVTLFLRD